MFPNSHDDASSSVSSIMPHFSFRGGVLCRIWEAIHQHRTRRGGGGGDGEGDGGGGSTRQHQTSSQPSSKEHTADTLQDPTPSTNATQEGEPT